VHETTVARTYAEALFALAERHGLQAEFAAAAEELAALLAAEPRVRLFLESPAVEPQAKKRVLVLGLRGRVPPLFLRFLLLVVDRRRQHLLAEIAREYHALLDAAQGRIHVQVTLAREPDERLEEEIASELSTLLGRTAIPHVRVDPRILGGIVVRYDDRVADGSLRHRLVGLRRRLLAAPLPARPAS